MGKKLRYMLCYTNTHEYLIEIESEAGTLKFFHVLGL